MFFSVGIVCKYVDVVQCLAAVYVILITADFVFVFQSLVSACLTVTQCLLLAEVLLNASAGI